MRLRLALPLAGIGVLFASCGGERQATAPRPTPRPTIDAKVTLGTRAVTDMTGRELHVPEFVNRVVAITPSAADFALALGLELVGRTSDSAGTAVASTTTVGSSLSPDFNAIAALKPDLVIGDTAYDGARLRDFDRFAYPVFLLSGWRATKTCRSPSVRLATRLEGRSRAGRAQLPADSRGPPLPALTGERG